MKKISVWMILLVSLLTLQCKKEFTDPEPVKNKGKQQLTKAYTAEVAVQWMNLMLDFFKAAPTATGNAAFSRHYAYTGIALYEAVVPGMPANRSLAGQLNGLEELPSVENNEKYNWALSANAALAEIIRKFFAYLPPSNLSQIDLLEEVLAIEYGSQSTPEIVQRSIVFGREIAHSIYDWSETDGYKNASNPFSAPADKIGPGFWVPPATPSVQSIPYWKNLRRMVTGSEKGTELPAPPTYDTDPNSEFYKMVKEVHEASPTPGSPERAMAFYWRDVPGTTTPGHYISILKQVLEHEKHGLDMAGLSFAMCGIMVYDACISTWETKYQYWLARPVTYIKNVLGHSSWEPTLGTPPHPEYPSAHSSLSAANAEALTSLFGDNRPFVDHTFDYLYNETNDPLLFKARSYPSFRAMADEAGLSRLYGGIHYRFSIEQGLIQGRKVAANIQQKLHFK